MPRPKQEGPPGYEPAIQFRPVPALAKLVKSFAERHGPALNEAYKNLTALAVVGLDVRYFELVNQMAVAMGGSNAFVHACLQVHAAMNGAALAGRTLTLEPERSLFILKIVQDFLESNQRQLHELDLWFLSEAKPAAEETASSRQKTFHGRNRRTIRPIAADTESVPQEQTDEEKEWSPFEQERGKARTRP